MEDSKKSSKKIEGVGALDDPLLTPLGAIQIPIPLFDNDLHVLLGATANVHWSEGAERLLLTPDIFGVNILAINDTEQENENSDGSGIVIRKKQKLDSSNQIYQPGAPVNRNHNCLGKGTIFRLKILKTMSHRFQRQHSHPVTSSLAVFISSATPPITVAVSCSITEITTLFTLLPHISYVAYTTVTISSHDWAAVVIVLTLTYRVNYMLLIMPTNQRWMIFLKSLNITWRNNRQKDLKSRLLRECKANCLCSLKHLRRHSTRIPYMVPCRPLTRKLKTAEWHAI